MRTMPCALAFAAALAAGPALADLLPDSEGEAAAWREQYERAERELFDRLHADPSPRVQVLAARVYLSDRDEGAPLRPKGADVVARAASLAPDDAVVQWVAASAGQYGTNQCGPVRWPEAEVANLVRLEPDNAAAWQYAVALAQAKGDQAGIDLALERMATARRADDHEGDEVATWTQVFAANPESPRWDGEPAPDALSSALRRTGFRYASSDSALEKACAPDGSSEQAWRRLDWCALAGRLLATEGNSFALRELGLTLLGKGEGHADLQRELAWLQAHASDPSTSLSAHADAATDRAQDWRGASGSVVAAERRLARLGKSAKAPEGWASQDADDDAEGESADAWLAYMGKVLDAMRASGDAREQVLAVLAERGYGAAAPSTAAEDGTGKAAAPTIDAIAATRPDDVLVQRVAALNAEGPARTGAIARLQQLDPANAATWALSLPHAGDGADPLPTLRKMAASRHYDEYMAGYVGLWSTAFERVPLSPDVMERMQAMAPDFDPEAMSKIIASGAMLHLHMDAAGARLFAACGPDAATNPPDRLEPCIAIGRILLREGRTGMDARFGAALLRKLDALEGADVERARQLAWWQQASLPSIMSGEAADAYVTDWLSTGSEVEALRLAAVRAGKAEPPAGWQPPKHPGL